ncbi:MAG: TatD family hydrolase, partial [Bacteroidales bacterium]|nr:TatD family hydrolase [Bacteroidales bacterium]
ILHIVKAWELLYEIVDEVFPSLSNPSDPILIVHGFRKNVTFAKQLISRGFYLSLGEKYNPEVLSLIPSGKIFRETDRTIEE